jgi:hypothetical protein
VQHVAECAHDRAQHAKRKSAAGNLPVLQVRWLEVHCKRHGCAGTYNY